MTLPSDPLYISQRGSKSVKGGFLVGSQFIRFRSHQFLFRAWFFDFTLRNAAKRGSIPWICHRFVRSLNSILKWKLFSDRTLPVSSTLSTFYHWSVIEKSWSKRAKPINLSRSCCIYTLAFSKLNSLEWVSELCFSRYCNHFEHQTAKYTSRWSHPAVQLVFENELLSSLLIPSMGVGVNFSRESVKRNEN